MIIAARLKRFFTSHQVPYEILHHPRMTTLEGAGAFHQLPLAQVLTTKVLHDHKGILLVIHALDRPFNLDHLNEITGRSLSFVAAKEVDRLFQDCEPGQIPAFGEPYGLVTYMERVVLKQPTLYLGSGSSHSMVQLDTNYLPRLNSHRKLRFYKSDKRSVETRKESAVMHASSLVRSVPVCHLKRFYSIPMLPDSLQAWLSLPHQSLDPESLQEALIAYPLLNTLHRKAVQSGDGERFAAFSRMVLSVRASEQFSSPTEGPLGLKNLRLEAILSGLIAQGIAAEMEGIDQEALHLAALFHNFGYLLMSHLFSPEFMMLNKLITVHPEQPIESLEARIVGLGSAHHLVGQGHAHMGAWLMRHWGMPEAVAEIVAHHHNQSYEGRYRKEVQCLLLTGNLLRQEGIGEGVQDPQLQLKLCESLEIKLDNVLQIVKESVLAYKIPAEAPIMSLQSEG